MNLRAIGSDYYFFSTECTITKLINKTILAIINLDALDAYLSLLPNPYSIINFVRNLALTGVYTC